MNAKISVLVICVEAIIYLLLYNLHDCTFKVFYIQIWFKCETQLWFFLVKNMVYIKTLFIEKIAFSVDYVKMIELHVVHTRRHIQSE